MDTLARHRPFMLLMLVSVCLLLPHLGALQTNIMEARNIITAREMVQDGHWIFTTINGLPRYEKPPLPTWLTAFSGFIFGFKNMFWLRLPVVLITLLLVNYFYRFCKKFFASSETAGRAGFILISSFYIFFAGRDNQWDMYAHAFMMGSIYFAYKALKIPKPNIELLYSALFFGCSFLSKGPVSPYALFLPFAIAYTSFLSKQKLRDSLYLLGIIAVGVIIGLSWPVYVKLQDPASVQAALQQESTRWAGYNTKPFWYYWSFFLQSGLWAIPAFVSLLLPFMLNKVSSKKEYLFSFAWLMGSVILLSCIPEKKTRYLLPVLIPLAFNTSFLVEYFIKTTRAKLAGFSRTLLLLILSVYAIIFAALPVILFFLTKKFSGIDWFWYSISFLSCYAITIAFVLSIFRQRILLSFLLMIAYLCSLVLFAFPLAHHFFYNPAFVSPQAISIEEKKYNIQTYEADNFTPEITLGYGKKIPSIIQKNSFQIPALSSFGVLMAEDTKVKMEALYPQFSYTRLLKIDVNNVAPGSKKHSPRLTKSYFLIRKQ